MLNRPEARPQSGNTTPLLLVLDTIGEIKKVAIQSEASEIELLIVFGLLLIEDLFVIGPEVAVHGAHGCPYK